MSVRRDRRVRADAREDYLEAGHILLTDQHNSIERTVLQLTWNWW